MNMILSLTAIGVLWCTTPATTQVTHNEAEKSEITRIIQSFYESFEQEDMELMSAVMAHDADMVSFGTGLTEHHVGWDAWKQAHLGQFEAFAGIQFVSKGLNVFLSECGTVAWFADVFDLSLVVENEQIDMSDLRITGVLEKRADQWKIVQIHASVPQE